MKKPTAKCSIFCYFANTGDVTKHYQEMPLKDITRWIESYQFTHPAVSSISVKVYTGKEWRHENDE